MSSATSKGTSLSPPWPEIHDSHPHAVEITHNAGVPYAPHRYLVTIRTTEELDPHIERLREYVESCPIDTHDNVGFGVLNVMRRNYWIGYSASLPPIILEWVQSQPEVEQIGKSPRVSVCTEVPEWN
jgi:hypothetical protein